MPRLFHLSFFFFSSNRIASHRYLLVGSEIDRGPEKEPSLPERRFALRGLLLSGRGEINMGGVFGKEDEPAMPLSKLDAKMVEAMRQRAARGSSMRAFNTIILKFPRIDESLRKCKTIFEEFDEDSNGAIDHNELKSCFEKLEVTFTEEETNDLFEACDINDINGIQFNEFVVVLSLVYLLHEPTTPNAKSRLGESIKVTFETIVDAFVFLDENKDGFVNKIEMVHAINETTSGERSSHRIAMKRFEEMDWDRNGMVTFKEFVFAFTRWVGMDDLEDED